MLTCWQKTEKCSHQGTETFPAPPLARCGEMCGGDRGRFGDGYARCLSGSAERGNRSRRPAGGQPRHRSGRGPHVQPVLRPDGGADVRCTVRIGIFWRTRCRGLVGPPPASARNDGCRRLCEDPDAQHLFRDGLVARAVYDVGLGHWETLTFSMTNCASGLAAVHFAASLGQPFILLSGEKAFHPAGNRLSVGLLGKAGVSGAVRAGRQIPAARHACDAPAALSRQP